MCSQELQRPETIADLDKMGVRPNSFIQDFADYEILHPLPVHFFNEGMTISPWAYQGKEQGCFWENNFSAINYELLNLSFFRNLYNSAIDDLGYMLN